MQSLDAIRSLRLLPAFRARLLSLARASTTPAAGAGDPAIHSDDPQGEDAEAAAKHAAAVERRKALGEDHTNHPPPPPTAEKIPPFAPSTRLENSELNPPPDPSFQQKRRQSTTTTTSIEGASCVGWDGRPLDGDGLEADWGEREREQEEMNREYFEKHKATPLSEVEFVDTRKPAARAWDRAADAVAVAGMGFVKEDMDETLERAEAMFRAAKESGDPDTPWGRVVARKRAEGSVPV